jgi:hypothetical protein
MFEWPGDLSVADLRGLVDLLARVDDAVTNAVRVDQLNALERVKAAVAATQARVTAAFLAEEQRVAAEWRERVRVAADGDDFDAWRAARDEERRHSWSVEPGRGARSARRGSGRKDRVGIVAQIALARRVSPSRAAGLASTAMTLVHEMPATLAALEVGDLSEWRAELVVRECQVLDSEHRAQVDVELDELRLAGQLDGLGDRDVVRRVRAIAYRVDPASVVERGRIAEGRRRLTVRPAPDTMCYVTALLPVAQGVAVHAALLRTASSARAAGDERSQGQLMADTLVARVTGREAADEVPVELQVVITDRALLAGEATPAAIAGYGPVPAPWVRALVASDAVGTGVMSEESEVANRARVWVRRLFTHPDDGTLVAMDSERRLFEGGLRRFLLARDGTCRTPWCDAPVRHVDHVVDHASGGPTSGENGQGLCVRCNHAKQAAGWRARASGGGDEPHRWRAHTVVITTPTGHRYSSTAPPVLVIAPDDEHSPLERACERLLAA